MALSVLRLRRAVSPLSATLIKHRVYSRAPIICSITDQPNTQVNPSRRPHQLTPLLGFRSSAPLSDRRFDSGDSKISPDEILFEGCDYNHWLITMDFPDDPKPTPEQMVETYVETLAKVVGSREEAMKRMYACSTTTYTGFQAVMTEEMSEKFRGLPGVVFILPDSYIDPVNKEYGGDKYEMGKITPRPPPVQYGRQGRYNDRNRNYDRPRYDRPQVQGNRQFDNQGGFNQGDGRNYAPPQQNYNPMGQQGISMNDTHGSTQGQGSPYRPPAGYNPGQQGNQPYNPQGSAPGNPRSYPPQNNYPQGNLGFPPSTGGMDYGPRSGQYGSRPQNPIPSYQPQGGFVQGRESQMGNDGPAAGGIHRQSPGYNYEQQYPGSEGYTGYNNAMNHGKN